MDVAEQRKLLTQLGFLGGEIIPLPAELAGKCGQPVAKETSTFLEQKDLPWPFSSGTGVTAATVDGGLWGREAVLTESEQQQLLAAGPVIEHEPLEKPPGE